MSKEKIIEDKNKIDGEQSTMSEDDLVRFLDLGNLRTDTNLRNAESDERPEDCLEDWVVLYEYPFKIGLRLPFPPIVRYMLQLRQVSSGQIMPQVWRVLSVIDRVTAS